MLKKVALPAAISYTILLTILSLVKLDEMPEIGTDFDDKLYHVLAYLVLTLLWFYAFTVKKLTRTLIYLAIGCVAFGIIIEVLQGRLTAYRVSDTLDIVANVLGVLIAIAYLFFKKKRIS